MHLTAPPSIMSNEFQYTNLKKKIKDNAKQEKLTPNNKKPIRIPSTNCTITVNMFNTEPNENVHVSNEEKEQNRKNTPTFNCQKEEIFDVIQKKNKLARSHL